MTIGALQGSATSGVAVTRVLVVDDDFMVADIHRRLVEREVGFTVVGTVHSAADALRSVVELEPDLVLLDVYLPDRHGLEVLAAIRSTAAKCDVIVITAARDTAVLRSVMRLGGLHYLIKPFDPEGLRAQLSRVRQLRLVTAALGATVTQVDVDRAFSALRTPASMLPKGFSSATLNLVVAALRSDLDQSTSEIAVATGISRPSARRYLEHLADLGHAEMRMRYGTTGRPEHLYRTRA